MAGLRLTAAVALALLASGSTAQQAAVVWSGKLDAVPDIFTPSNGDQDATTAFTTEFFKTHPQTSLCAFVLPAETSVLSAVGAFSADDDTSLPLKDMISLATASRVVRDVLIKSAADVEAIAASSLPVEAVLVSSEAESLNAAVARVADSSSATAFVFDMAGEDAEADAAKISAACALKGGVSAVVAPESFAGIRTSRQLLSAASLGAVGSSNSTTPGAIHATPEILSALFIAFILLLVLVAGMFCLLNISSPTHFPTNPPAVGKEY